jgi:uncharacterized protein YodC (DUF2158 family)
MAANFKKGEKVRVKVFAPSGPVVDFRIDSDGEIQYLVEWNDAKGNLQQRWFSEEDIVAGG